MIINLSQYDTVRRTLLRTVSYVCNVLSKRREDVRKDSNGEDNGKWTTGTETPSGYNWPSRNGSQDSHGRVTGQQEVSTGEIGQGGIEGADRSAYAGTPVGDSQDGSRREVGLMAYSPLAIANEFLSLAASENKAVEHMKLQKLVHFAHGYGLREGLEISNENPQVWKHGPVFESLYHELKYHGSDPISEPERESLFGPIPRVDGPDAGPMKILINKIWNKYKNFTGFQLSDKTHAVGTPWYEMVVEKGGRVPMGLEIPTEKIRTHYLGLPSLG